MPLRDPRLPNDNISPVFEKPNHLLRSPEDSLTLWQFMSVSWMSPLISVGYTRQLNDADVWQLSFEFQHRTLHEKFRELGGTVVRRLLLANGLDLVILLSLGVLEALSNFAGPILLQQLLRAMENPHAPRSRAVTFAVISLFVRLVACQSSVFSLWYSRRSYERSRGEMITMMYEKTLARKIVADSAPSNMPKPSGTEDGHTRPECSANTKPAGSLRAAYKTLRRFGRYFTRTTSKGVSPKAEKKPASIGKIYNLMRNDVYEVAQRFWEFQPIIRVPLSLVLSIVLVWKLIGWPCLFGVVTVIVAQSVNIFITRILLQYERERRRVTDGKLKNVTQYVAAIRHLRWYGWQDFWQMQIMRARQQELRLFVVTGLWRNTINVVNSLASGLFPVAAFYAYTALAGQPLRIDVAFPALQLFAMLENSLRAVPNLITVLLNANIAVGRIEDFMNEPDKDDAFPTSDPRIRSGLMVRDASFVWPGTSHYVLRNISLDFPVGLTVICGKVAAGKTALLQALLGELDRHGGDMILPNDTVGYCAQTPWLQSMSIRDNIIFISPYEEARYRKVLEACALTQDLATFKHGDLSNIGENGIGLSGGQKARVALARAIYSRAKVLFLDDPLSALDHQTAETIVSKCFGGSLTEGRITVLVTHRTALVRDVAQQVIEVSDGCVRIVDKETLPTNDSPKPTSSEPTEEQKQDEKDALDETAVPDKFIEDEKRVHGGVKVAVYWEYIKAGMLRWWAVLIFALILHRLVGLGETWFLKKWGEAYDRPVEQAVTSGFFNHLPSPKVNIRPWLLGFASLAAIQAAVFFLALCIMIVIVYSAGRQMFQDVVDRVSHATFRFYDVTPVGRLMNRLTSDIGTVDGNISQQFQNVVFLAITWISSIVVIASVTPVFLVFSFALTASFIMIFLKFLPSSQSLRRLEMVSLSPLMSNFGALLDGLTTVRVVDATHALCKQYGQLQMDFVSVERVVELLHLEQEPHGSIDPPARWPSYNGDIVFDNATIRYAPHLDPSLTDISFRIPAGSTTALLGRTGSGKSTLALSLLAIMKPESGRILIDNIDISQVKTQALRNRITFLAQEPVLFPGSMRQNLDPLDEHADDACDAVLQRIGSTYNWTLDTDIEAGGKNLSQGQRQLVGLARAILRRSAIVILDEVSQSPSPPPPSLCGSCATASIDTETATQIQAMLRDELKGSTVIIIAHRLEAVRDADFFLRLDEGKLVAAGPAGRDVS
ncbi:MAG: hypothetical protein Q9223_002701 [Gallowayella weberi]